MKKFGVLLIVLSGLLWGSMGVFLKLVQSFGFSAIQCTALRIGSAALVLWIFTGIFSPKSLKISFKELPMLILCGAVSVGGMSALYLSAIDMTSVSVAAVLLYMSPVWVMIFSVLFLKEKLTVKKVVAAVIAFLGCACIAGLSGDTKTSFIGILLGILSGVFYASYSIFGTFALRKNSGLTVTCYTFLFASVVSFCIGDLLGIIEVISASEKVLKLSGSVFLFGFITAVAPFAFYTIGLKYVNASKAAVLACIEPVTAAFFGFFLYDEPLNYLGIGMILIAILMLSKKEKE